MNNELKKSCVQLYKQFPATSTRQTLSIYVEKTYLRMHHPGNTSSRTSYQGTIGQGSMQEIDPSRDL